MKKGKLFVISGPSGVGKGTLCKRLMELRPLRFSVSMTTRSPRPGEEEGVNYYFVSREFFQKTLDENGFLEHAEVFQNRYGTPKAEVLQYLESGQDMLLDIDVQGALQVKRNYPEAILVFILPPSLSALSARLAERGTETKEMLEHRLNCARHEISFLPEYRYRVINNDLETAVAELTAIVDAEHCRLQDDAAELIEALN